MVAAELEVGGRGAVETQDNFGVARLRVVAGQGKPAVVARETGAAQAAREESAGGVEPQKQHRAAGPPGSAQVAVRVEEPEAGVAVAELALLDESIA